MKREEYVGSTSDGASFCSGIVSCAAINSPVEFADVLVYIS